MTLKALWIMLLVFSLSLPALGQTRDPTPSAPQTQSLSLDQAIGIALKTHPALKQASAAVAAAEAQVDEARAAYYPQLSFSAIGKIGLSGATSALGLPGFPGSPFFRNTAYSVNWLQSVFDFGRIKHYVALERALSTSAQLNEAEEQQRVVFDVKRAYLSVLEAQELERLGEETVKEQNLILERAQVYAQADIGPELDVRLAQASQAEAQGNLIHAKNAVATAFAALRAAMGVNGPQAYRLIAPQLHVVSLPPLQDLVQEGFKNRPDEMALESRIAAASENVQLAHAQSLPTINAFVAGGQGRFNDTQVKENQRHGVGALGVILPIFTGGRLKAQRQEAQAGLEGTLAAREELRQQILLEVSRAYYGLLDTSERIRVAGQQQRAAEEALAMAQARYQEQLGSFLEVLTAQVAATVAETNSARMQFTYERAKASLDFATGTMPHPQ
jgi:outer membrane protein TolC